MIKFEPESRGAELTRPDDNGLPSAEFAVVVEPLCCPFFTRSPIAGFGKLVLAVGSPGFDAVAIVGCLGLACESALLSRLMGRVGPDEFILEGWGAIG